MFSRNNYMQALFIACLLSISNIASAQTGLAGALSNQKKRVDRQSDSLLKDSGLLKEKQSTALEIEGPMDPRRAKELKELDPYIWNLQIAKRPQEKDNFPDLLTAYSELVEKACMPQLHTTLSYDAQEKSKICLKYLSEFSAIAPQAPSLVCARDGIDAVTCTEAHRAMEVETQQRARRTNKETEELFGDSEADVEERLNRYIDKLLPFGPVDSLHKLPEKDRQEKLDQVHRILTRVLGIGCKGATYGVKKKKVEAKPKGQFDFLKRENLPKKGITRNKVTSFANRSTKPRPKIGSGRKVSGELKDETPTFFSGEQQNQTTTASRTVAADEVIVRYLTRTCQSQIDLAFKWDSNYYAAICSQYGEYSPNCIQASRAYRKILQARAGKKRATQVRRPNKGKKSSGKLFDTF